MKDKKTLAVSKALLDMLKDVDRFVALDALDVTRILVRGEIGSQPPTQ